MQNPFTLIGKLVSGGAVDTLHKIDEADVLRGLTTDVVDTIAERYKLVGRIAGNAIEFTLERRVP